MKYLKKFESFSSQVIEVLEDIFIEINDDPNWEVNCFQDGSVFAITISPFDYPVSKSYQILTDIVDSIKRSIDYMNEFGYKYDIFMISSEGDFKLNIDKLLYKNVWSDNFLRIEFFR